MMGTQHMSSSNNSLWPVKTHDYRISLNKAQVSHCTQVDLAIQIEKFKSF